MLYSDKYSFKNYEMSCYEMGKRSNLFIIQQDRESNETSYKYTKSIDKDSCTISM